jgi:hypothetical protein
MAVRMPGFRIWPTKGTRRFCIVQMSVSAYTAYVVLGASSVLQMHLFFHECTIVSRTCYAPLHG